MTMGALGFEVMLGALTTTGSLLAFAKLQGLVRGTPMTYKGQNIFNMALLAVTIGIFIYLIIVPGSMPLFFTMAGLAFIFGLLLVMPIGSADMPVVMSLLNSYAGLASAATGFVLSNKVLIIAGTLDGFSGFILSILMCRAMNRSMTNVLFGAFGSAATAEGRRRATGIDARSRSRRHRHPTRLCEQSHLRAGLWTGNSAGATRRARTRRRARETRRHSEIRNPSGRRPHAGTHERAARRSKRSLFVACTNSSRSILNFRQLTSRS